VLLYSKTIPTQIVRGKDDVFAGIRSKWYCYHSGWPDLPW